jgi:hypothetical protein
MPITIPKQHYVTIQYRKDAKTESGLLGFASPYTKDAAFEKRKSSQEGWAYGASNSFVIGEDGSILPSADSKIDRFTLFATKCYPIIMDNVLVDGFEVSKSVKRSGWSGSGNVVWRIADPRGFELEISSENFARIIDCTTVEQGKILGKCMWGREGAKNILLPEASDVYQEAVKLTVKTNTKISLKDVQVGDIVEILSTKVPPDDLVCQYLGKYFFLEVRQFGDGSNRYAGSGKFRFNAEQTERYLLKSEKTGKYFVLTSPKVVGITTKIGTPLDKTTVATEVTGKLSLTNSIRDADLTILLSPTKIDLMKVQTTMAPLDPKVTADQWPSVDKYYSSADSIICGYNGEWWVARTTNIGGYNSPNVPSLVKVSLDLANNAFDTVTIPEQSTGGWGFRNSQVVYRQIVETNIVPAEVEQYRLSVTANGITGRVYRLGYF